MVARDRKARVHLTYTVQPVRRFGLSINESFESDALDDAEVWGVAIADAIRARIACDSPSDLRSSVLVIELATSTPQRYRANLERGITRVLCANYSHLFAGVVCNIK